MALEIGMNLVCSVLEQVVMCVCQYLFMSANAQTIHRKKIWYFFGFTALVASVYGAAFLTGLTGNLWIGVQIQLTGVLLLGILLFHRKIGSLLLDLFVNILLILSIEVGIFLGNYLLAQGAFENLVWYGNVTMLFKMFFMIPLQVSHFCFLLLCGERDSRKQKWETCRYCSFYYFRFLAYCFSIH